MASETATLTALFNEPEGRVYHVGAVAYAISAYVLGWIGLFHSSWLVNVPAMLLLAHSMVVAAYLVHECAHNTIFSARRYNTWLGRAMSWLCGAAYGTYEDIRYKHFRHHVDNDDVVWFDYDRFFARHPRVTRAVRALEWLYIPAHDLLMHAVMVATSFVIPQRREQRLRNVTIVALRGGALMAVLFVAPRAVLLYSVAYLLMIHVLRFMDMLQHDYPYNLTLFEYRPPRRKGDFAWEQEHTFSNPLSLRFERLNWLTLNFGYHNAHHADMNRPWYRLPALHRELTGDDPEYVIPFGSQLHLYHDNRMDRVFNTQPQDYPKGQDYLQQARAGRGAIGGNAASFLTSF